MKRGAEKSFSHAEEGGGGHNKFWGSFYRVAWSFSHTDGRGGGHKKFPLFKGGGGGARKVLPCLGGGGGG